MQASLDGSVLLGFPPGLRMRRCSCWSNSGLCHYAISEWDGMKQHPVHSNQQANQSKPQVWYCHSEIGQSQEGFSCWSFSLFMRHPIEIIIKNSFNLCALFDSQFGSTLIFTNFSSLFQTLQFKQGLSPLQGIRAIHQHSRLRHNKLPEKTPVIAGGQIRDCRRIHCSCLSFLECSKSCSRFQTFMTRLQVCVEYRAELEHLAAWAPWAG